MTDFSAKNRALVTHRIAPLAVALALVLPAAPAGALCHCVKCLTGGWQFFQQRGTIIAFRHPVTPGVILIQRVLGPVAGVENP